MKLENENYELIELYLADKLSPEQKSAFEQRALSDPEFADEVTQHTLAREEIHATAMEDLRSRLHQRFDNLVIPESEEEEEEEQEHKVIHMQRRRFQWVTRIAAAVLVLVLIKFAFDFINKPSYSADQLVAMNFVPPELKPVDTTRGPDDTLSEADTKVLLIGKAIQAIRDKDPKTAIQYYEQLLEDSAMVARSGSMLNYQMGIAQMLDDNPTAAISYFDQVSSFLYIKQATWYKGLAYLKSGNPDQAKTLITEVAQDQNQPADRRGQAKKLLEQMENLKE